MKNPFAAITAFEPAEPSSLQEELIPLKYAAYRCPTVCVNCQTRQTESKLFLVLGHLRRVDVAKMTVVNKFTMNLPIEVRDLALRELPACFMCYDDSADMDPPDLSHLPEPANESHWQDAVARARAKADKDRERSFATGKARPTVADI